MPYSRLFYHIVWTTWQREPLIVSENRLVIYSTIRDKLEKLGGMVLALNGMEDHVHLVASIPAVASLAQVIGQIKGVSSYVASRLSSPDAIFQWQKEYGILTVSESHLETVVSYVDRQQDHHFAGTLHSKLERFALDD